MSNPESYEDGDEHVTVPIDIGYDSLLEILVNAKLPLEQYGIDDAKTVHHLLREIQDGESVLSVDSKGELLRELRVLWIDVFCNLSNGEAYVLKEEKQVFNNGYVGIRDLSSSIGEKLKAEENPGQAVYRALSEELGIEGELDSIEYQGEERKQHSPKAFPGLESTYQFYKYAVVIPENDFKPEGYIERQEDKTNYYTWSRTEQA